MQLDKLGCRVRDIVSGGSLTVVTDEHVEKLHLQRCRDTLEEAGFAVHSFVIPPGEGSKDGQTYLELVNFLAEIPLTRADAVVALGGGVVGDLAGFAAATYLRGIKVIQVPTTLLAAVDSSIGGKTAINLKAGKNLAGAFHQPALICCDAELLRTLPEDVFLDGMAEVIKYGVIADAQLFQQLTDPQETRVRLAEVIERCASIKMRFVEEDEHDTGIRQMLNFGHTIGHAIEKASGYQISHGKAVAKGMARIAEIAARCGWCSRNTEKEIRAVLETYGFDLDISYSNETLYEIMKTDKKRKGRFIDIVVPEEIGRCRLQRLTTEELGEIL